MKEQYSEEFKQEAVRLVIRNNRQIKKVAQDLGVNHWTLKDWVEKYGKPIHSELVEKGMSLTPEEKIKLLQKELNDVSEERDILKKAIAVFSKKPKINLFL